jgi:hypothetical protein
MCVDFSIQGFNAEKSFSVLFAVEEVRKRGLSWISSGGNQERIEVRLEM